MERHCEGCRCLSMTKRRHDEGRRDFLEREIAFHQNQLVSLRSQRNSLSFVAKLPSEILSVIFLLCRESRKTVSWVCRTWRSIALTLQSLWAEIRMVPGFEEANLRELLARSKSYPLVLSYTGISNEYVFDSAADSMFVPVRRPKNTRSLYVKEEDPCANLYLFCVLAAEHMDRIEVVDISAVEGADYCFGLPELFRSASAPALKTLRLKGFYYLPLLQSPLLASAASRLTELRLVAAIPTEVEILLEALQKLKFLVVLELEEALGDFKTPHLTSSRHLSRYTTHLPHLRDLVIRQSCLRGSLFFSFLRFPFATRVELDFPYVLHQVIGRLERVFLPRIRLWDENDIVVPRWNIGFGIMDKTVLLSLSIPDANRFTIGLKHCPRSREFASSLYQALPSKYVRSITYRGTPSFLVCLPWIDGITHLESLEEIFIISSVGKTSLYARSDQDSSGDFSATPNVSSRPDVGSFFFNTMPTNIHPNLFHLSMSSFILNQSSVESLCRWLTARAALGLGLSRISMVDCEITNAGLNAIRQIVPDLLLDADCEVTQ